MNALLKERKLSKFHLVENTFKVFPKEYLIIGILDSIYRLFLIHFTPNDDKTLRKYELIHLGVSRPIHFKIAETPDEKLLYTYLEKNGFKITDEHLYSESTVYDIARA